MALIIWIDPKGYHRVNPALPKSWRAFSAPWMTAMAKHRLLISVDLLATSSHTSKGTWCSAVTMAGKRVNSWARERHKMGKHQFTESSKFPVVPWLWWWQWQQWCWWWWRWWWCSIIPTLMEIIFWWQAGYSSLGWTLRGCSRMIFSKKHDVCPGHLMKALCQLSGDVAVCLTCEPHAEVTSIWPSLHCVGWRQWQCL